jgi:hypothetical protein
MKNEKNVVDVSTPVYKKKKVKTGYLVALGITVAITALVGVYVWQTNEAKKKSDEYTSQIKELEAKIAAFEAATKKTETENSQKRTVASPSAEVTANVIDAVGSKNYAALEAYMADSVNVILAASEGIGARTPAQATNDLKYLDAATAPWDFSLPAATIASWRAGDYGRYIPATNTIIGKSSDGYVVVFAFDSDNNVTSIFMAVNDELL